MDATELVKTLRTQINRDMDRITPSSRALVRRVYREARCFGRDRSGARFVSTLVLTGARNENHSLAFQNGGWQ